MRLFLTTAVVVALLTGARSEAQPVRAAQPGDSLLVAENIYDNLFDGIDLARPKQAAVRNIILRAYVEQRGHYPITSREEWLSMAAVQTRRDSVLRSMITDPEDRATFDARAARAFPRTTLWKP